MTIAERDIHIQDLQVRHATPYSSTLYKRLITGGCADLKENSQIAYMIKMWYRYWALPSTLTSFQFVTVANVSESVDFTVSLFGVDLTTVISTSGSMATATSALVEGIQYTSETTGVYAFEYDGGLILWSSKDTYSIDNSLSLTNNVGVTEITSTHIDPSNEDNVAVILDRNNCISYCELSRIKKYLLNLLTSC